MPAHEQALGKNAHISLVNVCSPGQHPELPELGERVDPVRHQPHAQMSKNDCQLFF